MFSGKRDRGLMSCCALAALGLGATASNAQAAAQSATAVGTAASGLEDIVVTARRVSETAQKVPLAVTAFSPATLTRQGITQVGDLVHHVPSLNITPNQGRSAASIFNIRGQQSSDNTLNLDASVGISLGEVPLASSYGVNVIGFLDVQTVEVLKGPQGTLFGRNTTGGVINITPNAPSFGKFDGSVTIGLGDYARKEITGVINVPLGDDLAFRVAGQFADRNGLYKNIAPGEPNLDDQHYGTTRASLKWRSGGFTTTIAGDYTKIHEHGSGPVANGALPGGLAGRYPLGIGGGYQTFSDEVAQGKYHVYAVGDSSRLNTSGISDISTLDLGDNLTLKNIIAYRHLKIREINDNDGSPYPILNSAPNFAGQNQFSAEFLLQYRSHLFDLIGGVFHLRAKGYDGSLSAQIVGIAPGPNYIRGAFLNKSYAAFAQTNIHITDKLDLTAGVRYTRDERSFSVVNQNLGTGRCNLVSADIGGTPLNPCAASNKAHFSEPTYSVSLNYRLTDRQLVYFTARRGYRSGGFTLRATRPSELQPFKPEFVNDLEIGYKGDITLGGDAKLRLNAAAFRSKLSNGIRSQTRCGAAIPGNSCPFTSTIFLNAAKATIWGIELEPTFIPVDGIEISGFYNYTHAKYDSWTQQGAGGTVVDLSGNHFAGVAKNRGGATIRARLPYRDEGNIWFQVGAFATQHYQGQDVFVGDEDVKGYAVFDGRIEWNHVFNSKVDAALWVKNIGNREYFVGKYANGPLGLQTGFYGEPRTFGVDVTLPF